MLKRLGLGRHDTQYWDALFLFAFSLLFFFTWMIRIPVNGDTYTYARSIMTLEGPLIHLGYFVIGFLLHSFLQLFGISALETLGCLSVFFGAISVVCMYLLVLELTQDRFQGLLAGGILLFAGDFWFFSEHGEVYVPQLGFVLLSLLFMMKKRPLISSIFFLVAVSVTPTSSLVFPALACVMLWKGYGKKQIAYFLLPIFFSLLFLLFWDLKRIMNIIGEAVYSPKVFFDSFSYKALFMKLCYDTVKVYGKAFNIFSLVALLGFVLLYRENRKIWIMVLVFCAPFSLYLLNLGLISGDHLILTFAVISFLASYAVSRVVHLTKRFLASKYLVVLALLCMHGMASYSHFIGPEIRDSKELERVMMDLSRDYRDNEIMIADYNFGMAFWYLMKNERDFFLLTGRPNRYLEQRYNEDKEYLRRLERRFWINLPHLAGFFSLAESKGVVDGRRVYYVDRSDWPTRIVRHLLTDKDLEKRKLEIPKLKGLQAYFGKKTGERIEFVKIIDSPLYPVYLLERTEK